MTSLEKYPFDYESIQKGTVISRKDIESITGVNHPDDKYRLLLMGLRENLESGLRQIGKFFVVTCQHDQLNVLTDEAATEYKQRMFERRRKGMARDHALMLHVDTSQLSDESKKDHERALVYQSKQLLAMKQARKEVKIELAERKTPVLFIESEGSVNAGVD